MFLKKRKKKKRKMMLYITIMILFTFGITIGYSMLSSSLSVGGAATAVLDTVDEELNNSQVLLDSPSYVLTITDHGYMALVNESYTLATSSLTQLYSRVRKNKSFLTWELQIAYINDYSFPLTAGQVAIVTDAPTANIASCSASLDVTSLAIGETAYVNVTMSLNNDGLLYLDPYYVTTTLKFTGSGVIKDMTYQIGLQE